MRQKRAFTIGHLAAASVAVLAATAFAQTPVEHSAFAALEAAMQSGDKDRVKTRAPMPGSGEGSKTEQNPVTPPNPKDAKSPSTPPPKPADKPQDKPADRDRDKAADREKSADKERAKSADKDVKDDDDGGNPDKAVAHKVMLEESKYRKRMAKIARLRELAQEQGNQQRLAALDKLEAKTKQLHDRKIADAKAKLGDEKFKKVDAQISKGRGKNHGNAPAVPPGLEKKGVTQHPGQGRDKNDSASATDRPRDKDKDKPNDADKSKGKGDKPDKPDKADKDNGRPKANGNSNRGGGKP